MEYILQQKYFYILKFLHDHLYHLKHQNKHFLIQLFFDTADSKDKKGVSIINVFQKILGNSKRKPNKIWVDQGSEFYNSQFKTFLKDNNIKMYSTCNKRKSVVA